MSDNRCKRVVDSGPVRIDGQIVSPPIVYQCPNDALSEDILVQTNPGEQELLTQLCITHYEDIAHRVAPDIEEDDPLDAA